MGLETALWEATRPAFRVRYIHDPANSPRVPLYASYGFATGPTARAKLARINATGRVYLTHTVLPGFDGSDGGEVLPPRYVLRMAIGATRTEERHVRGAWEVVCAAAE